MNRRNFIKSAAAVAGGSLFLGPLTSSSTTPPETIFDVLNTPTHSYVLAGRQVGKTVSAVVYVNQIDEHKRVLWVSGHRNSPSFSKENVTVVQAQRLHHLNCCKGLKVDVVVFDEFAHLSPEAQNEWGFVIIPIIASGGILKIITSGGPQTYINEEGKTVPTLAFEFNNLARKNIPWYKSGWSYGHFPLARSYESSIFNYMDRTAHKHEIEAQFV